MNFTKKEKRTVLLAVIAGIIIFFFQEIWTNIASLFSWFAKILSVIKDFLMQDTDLPVIGVIILALTSVPVFLKILRLLWKPFRKEEIEKSEPQISFVDYRKDNIEGVDWQWEWVNNSFTGKYDLDNLFPFCPSCGMQMYLNTDYDTYNYNHREVIIPACPNKDCSRTFTPIAGNRQSVLDLVTLHIKRKINTDIYKDVVKANLSKTKMS